MYNPPDHYVMPSLPSRSTHDVRGIPREFNHEYSTRGCWPEHWLSRTFKHLKLLYINSKDMIKNVGFKLFIKVVRRKNYVS